MRNHLTSMRPIENIATFRRIQQPSELYHIPEIPQKRKMTDVAFLMLFAVCVVILLSLMVYSATMSDIQRLIHGYDSCGNVCGSKNSPDTDWSCPGQDMTDKPFLVYERLNYYSTIIPRHCANSCDSSLYTIRFHRCFPSSIYDSDDRLDVAFLPYVLEKIEDESVGLTVVCLVGLGLTIIALVTFRYFLNIFVWVMITTAVLSLFVITGLLWYLYAGTEGYNNDAFLYCAIFFTVFSIFFLICILVLVSKIKLMIRFFEEAVTIIFAMPLILLEPALTFFSNFVVLAIFLYTFLLMSTSGNLKEAGYNIYEYSPNAVTTVAQYLSVILTLWVLQFILACQQMVISGAVSAYYFTRDKLTLVSPIYGSFYNLIRYHLGTTAFGSFIITAVIVFKIILQGMRSTRGWAKLVYLCCRPIENVLQYVTSMGYIETAIHGQPLCRSSFRAVNLIVANYLSAVAMNSVGNLVFFMTKLVVVIVAVAVGLAMQLSEITLVFGGCVAFICVHSVFVVFEIAVDTVFICYCEDQCVNDGMQNPYYTAVDLYCYIKKAQIITQKEGEKNK